MTKLSVPYIKMHDFRLSEASNYALAARSYRPLRRGEVFLFYSRSGNQIVWILNVTENGVVDSRRWRLPTGETWHPWMISEYARECGLTVNVRDFRSYLAKKLGLSDEDPT